MVYTLDEKVCELSFVDYNGKSYSAIPKATAPKENAVVVGGGSCTCDVAIDPESGNWLVNGENTGVSAKGQDLRIKKSFPTVEELNADDTLVEGDLAIIASTVEDEDNAKLYVRTPDGFTYLTDLSGAKGIQGPEGPQGERGPEGATGRQGAKGDAGATGPKGEPGQSAYQLWLAQGNQGDQQAFLASLVGPRGADGENGTDGNDGATGPKGEKGDPLRIKKTYPSVEAMNADDNLIEGDLVVIASGSGQPDNGKLFVKTSTENAFLVDLSGADGIKGEKGDPGQDGAKGEDGEQGPEGPTGPRGETGATGLSAYQTWLSLGNTGDERAFLETLKGPKGDKGDVTDIGVTALEYHQANISSTAVRTTSSNPEYRRLTYNTKTMWGTLHLDLTPRSDSGVNHVVGTLPVGVPRPYTLIEVNAIGSGGSVGQVYIMTNGRIQANNLKQGERYIVDLTGYYQ